MSKQTKALDLFEYDTILDAKKTFNINKALNENWDKIDDFADYEKLNGVYFEKLKTITVKIPTPAQEKISIDYFEV